MTRSQRLRSPYRNDGSEEQADMCPNGTMRMVRNPTWLLRLHGHRRRSPCPGRLGGPPRVAVGLGGAVGEGAVERERRREPTGGPELDVEVQVGARVVAGGGKHPADEGLLYPVEEGGVALFRPRPAAAVHHLLEVHRSDARDCSSLSLAREL